MKSTAGETRKSAVSVVAGVAALGLVVFGWLANRARASGQSGSQVREEVTVALKLLQAYVTTKDGKPVTDLTAADFEITDNGQKMPVTHFENHAVGGEGITPGAPVEGPRLNRKFFFFFDFAFTDPRGSRKAREAALQFLDTAIKPGDEVGVLSYSPMRGLTIHEYLTTNHARVRNIVDTFGLRTAAGRAETLTDFLYAEELGRMQDTATRNPAGGSAQPAQGSAAGGGLAPDVFFQEQARAQGAGVVDEGRLQRYADQARQFAETFANLARAMRYIPGWKNLILFSSGISGTLIYGNSRGMNVPDTDASHPNQLMAELSAYDDAQSNTGVRAEFAAALKELKNANSPIYAIDCTPAAGQMDITNLAGTPISSREITGKDSLVQLAGESGGKYFSNSMETKSALAAVGEITRAFYVLGYGVSAAWDGAFHKIKVKVVRPGCRVVSQNGYYNPKPFQEYSRFERLLLMADLALSDNPLSPLPTDVSMDAKSAIIGGLPYIVAYVEVPKDTAAAIIGKRTDAYLLTYDEEQGRSAVKSFRVKPPEGGATNALAVFAIPTKPGRYSCRIIILNAETGVAARGSASVIFANPVAAPVWIDPPLLLREATGWSDLGAAPETTLSGLFGYDPNKYAPIRAELPRGPQRVLAALRLSLGRPEIELDITATDTLGTVKTEVPVTAIETRQVKSLRTCLVEMTFGDLKPGHHTLTIAARDKSGAEGNETTATFTVK